MHAPHTNCSLLSMYVVWIIFSVSGHTRVDIMNYSVGTALARTRMNVRVMRLCSSHLARRPLATSFINIYNKLPRRAESRYCVRNPPATQSINQFIIHKDQSATYTDIHEYPRKHFKIHMYIMYVIRNLWAGCTTASAVVPLKSYAASPQQSWKCV